MPISDLHQQNSTISPYSSKHIHTALHPSSSKRFSSSHTCNILQQTEQAPRFRDIRGSRVFFFKQNPTLQIHLHFKLTITCNHSKLTLKKKGKKQCCSHEYLPSNIITIS